jgi:hypothetical protein
VNLVEAFVQFTADTTRFDKAVDRVQSSLKGLKPSFDAIQTAAKATFFAIGGAFAFAVKGAADAEQEDAKLRASLKATLAQAERTKDGILDLSDALSRLRSNSTVTQDINTKNVGKPASPVAAPAAVGLADFDRIKSELDAYATALQRLTVYGDDFLKGQMAYALNLGVTADSIKEVTKLGIGLAEALFGGDVKAGIEAVAKAQQGNFRALEKLVPALKEAKTAEEKLAIVRRLGIDGFAQAEARAQTFTGTLRQMWENVGDLGETFGGIFLPALRNANNLISAVTIKLQQLTPEQQNQVVRWTAITAGVAGFIAFGPRIISSLSLVGSAIKGVSSLILNVGVTAFSALRKAMAATWAIAAANPFTLAIVAVAALATGIAYLGGTGDTAFERIKNGFANFNQSAVVAWNKTIQALSGVWNGFASSVRTTLGRSFDSLKATFNTVVGYWRGVLTSFDSFLRDTFGGIYTAVATVLGAVGQTFSTVFSFVASVVGEVIGYVGSLFAEGFGVIAGMVGDFASVFAAIADTMFGSWQGFVQGLVTLWNQAGFILLKGWYGFKALVLNVWEDLKYAGKSVFYYWGGVIAEFGVKTFGAMRTLVENIRNLWNKMIDAIASKMASFLAKRQAAADVDANFKEGDVIDDTMVKRLQLRLGISKEQAEAYRGKTLTADDIERLKEDTTKGRLVYQNRMESEERRRKEREHQEELARIQKETDAAVGSLRKWSDEGLKATVEDRDKGRAANNAERDAQLRDIEAARLKDLEADLKKMEGMPKLSDKVKAALDAIRSGIGFDKIRGLIKDIIDSFDKAKLDASKLVNPDSSNLRLSPSAQNKAFEDAGKNGKSIEQAFKENLTRRMLGATLIQHEEQRRKEEEKQRQQEEKQRQKEQAEATKKNTQTTEANTAVMEKINDRLGKGVAFGLA